MWEFIFYHPDQNVQNSFCSGVFVKVIYGKILDFGISIMRKITELTYFHHNI